jgi:hypothetical protein
MSKMRHVPIDDALRQFRFNALNTPLVAKDMTTLDKEMSDILSRTDLSKEHKLKKYYEALGKFQEARDIFKGLSNTAPADVPNPAQINEMETIINNTPQESSLGVNALFNDSVNANIDEEQTLVNTTPINTSTPKGIKDVTPRTSRSSKKKKPTDLERDKNEMKDRYLSLATLKNDSIRARSPSKGGDYKTIGQLNQVDDIFDYLFSTGEYVSSPKFAGNKRNNVLTKHVVNFLKQNANDNWKQKYPILKQKFSSIAGSGQKQQKGFGKVKINYKQWDFLNKKLNL